MSAPEEPPARTAPLELHRVEGLNWHGLGVSERAGAGGARCLPLSDAGELIEARPTRDRWRRPVLRLLPMNQILTARRFHVAQMNCWIRLESRLRTFARLSGHLRGFSALVTFPMMKATQAD